MKKIAISGVHGTGKSKICNKVDYYIICEKITSEKELPNHEIIPEQYREVVKDIPNFTKQTENITLETYARQLALECRYAEQGKNILCDRSVLDTFIYYDYLNYFKDNLSYIEICKIRESLSDDFLELALIARFKNLKTYSKIYLIEPSDRGIEPDGFRLTDKKQQLEIHKLFLERFKGFDNVEIINQEDAHKEEFVEKVVNQFIL
jgi:thymidylate kinase